MQSATIELIGLLSRGSVSFSDPRTWAAQYGLHEDEMWTQAIKSFFYALTLTGGLGNSPAPPILKDEVCMSCCLVTLSFGFPPDHTGTTMLFNRRLKTSGRCCAVHTWHPDTYNGESVCVCGYRSHARIGGMFEFAMQGSVSSKGRCFVCMNTVFGVLANNRWPLCV